MKESDKLCDLQSCFLCQYSLKEWLPAVDVHKKNFLVKKGQQLFKEGDPVNGIFFVYKGSVKVHKKWDREKELIIRFAKQGDIVGHTGLGDNPVYPVTATAIEPSVICYLETDFFETTLQVNTNLTYKLMRFFANELQESEKRMRNLAHMSVKARIAQSLITLKAQFGLTETAFIDIELTRQDLASFAAVSYETLFKVMNDLVHDKLIAITGKSIRITNEEMLYKLVKEDNL